MDAFSFQLSFVESVFTFLSRKDEVTVQLNFPDLPESIGWLSIRNVIFDDGNCKVFAQPEQIKNHSLRRPADPVNQPARKQVKKSIPSSAKTTPVFSAKQDFVKDPLQSKADVSSLINTLIKPGSNEKLFQCSFCTYQSIRSGDVKRHIELKHLPSGILFSCLTCGKTSKTKSNLKKHYMSVHNLLEPAANGMLASC